MKKHLLLVCILLVAVLISGCALIEKDEAVDMQTPIISIGDIVYTKGQVLSVEWSYYGRLLSASSDATYRDAILSSLEKEALQNYMIKKLELDTITDEELAALEEDAKTTAASYREFIEVYFFSGTELEGDELEKSIDEYMIAYGYTEESQLAEGKDTLLKARLKETVTKDITVTEEEARANYDETIASAKESYAANLSAFGTAYNSSQTIYYTPSGYRYVKNLEIRFTDEDAAIISDLKTKISAKEALVSSKQESIDSYAEAEAELNDEQKAALETLNAELLQTQAEKAELDAQLTAATDTAYQNIAATVTVVREKIAQGEDFAELMTTYGKDVSAINAATGYAICEGFTGKDEAFVSAAMALKGIGDTSETDIKISNGIQILSYAGDVSEGEVGFEAVKDTDAITKLEAKKTDAYNAQIEVWLKEYPVKVDKAALK